MSARNFDAIIIGGGLNGLTAAAYLARAGRKVVVLEAREELGGTAATGEVAAPGYRAPLLRHDIGDLPHHIIKDLNLLGGGTQFISSAAEMLALSPDGAALKLHGNATTDPGDSLRTLSPNDAAKWPEFARQVAALAGFLGTLYRAPMPGVDASSIGELLIAARAGLRLRGLGKKDMVEVLRVLPMSIAEYVEDTFEHPLLQGLLASRGVMHTNQGPKGAGTAFVMLHHQVNRAPGAFRSGWYVAGGPGGYADALARCATSAGAEIRKGALVSRIHMKGGRAVGVVVSNGDEYAASRIISAASPRATFLDLCDPAQLPPELVRAIGNIRLRGVTAKVHFGLDGLPQWKGDPSDAAKPARSIVIAPSVDYLERGYDDAKFGRVSSKPFLDVFIPTISDPSLAPAGKHLMSVHVQYAPYHLRDAGDGPGPSGITEWNANSLRQLSDHVLKTLAEYAPDLPGLVNCRHAFTPQQLEESFLLPEGNPYHGELALDQALFMRPVPECSKYATPVPGLWLCGSGSHPGGAVPGQAGANAANAILRG